MKNLEYYTNYRSKNYYPGSIHFNGGNEDDKIIILGKAKEDNDSKHFFIIKFVNTGFIKRINSSQLRAKIDDPMAPTVYGKGIVGVGEYKSYENGRQTKFGMLWYNMMQRCYSTRYHEYTPTYKDCDVCDRWLHFQLFCEDIQKLENYEEWLKDSFKWVLDKDTKVLGNKMYSPDTCVFISNSSNTIASNISKNKYLGISPDNTEYTFSNMRIFAEEHSLTKGGISSVINGKQKTHRGWVFKKLN